MLMLYPHVVLFLNAFNFLASHRVSCVILLPKRMTVGYHLDTRLISLLKEKLTILEESVI